MQQIGTKGIQDYVWLSGEGDLLGTVQEIKIWPYYKMRRKKFSGTLRYKWIPVQSPYLLLIDKKKELVICWIFQFQQITEWKWKK